MATVHHVHWPQLRHFYRFAILKVFGNSPAQFPLLITSRRHNMVPVQELGEYLERARFVRELFCFVRKMYLKFLMTKESEQNMNFTVLQTIGVRAKELLNDLRVNSVSLC